MTNGIFINWVSTEFALECIAKEFISYNKDITYLMSNVPMDDMECHFKYKKGNNICFTLYFEFLLSGIYFIPKHKNAKKYLKQVKKITKKYAIGKKTPPKRWWQFWKK